MARVTQSIRLVICLLIASLHLAFSTGNTAAQGATEFYVAPNGRPSNNGSINSPWDLQTALNQPSAVKPGATIWLRGGRYGTGGSTLFISELNGTKEKPIIVRQYPGERATVDGGIQSGASFVWWWGFEITNSSTQRTTTETGRRPGLMLGSSGDGNKVINMVIHDTGHPGISFSRQSDTCCDGEIYGTLVWGNGVYDTSPPGSPSNPWIRGSGTYTQNDGYVTSILDSIWFRNFTTGINAYGEGGPIKHFFIQGNIAFDTPQYSDYWIATNNSQCANPIEKLMVIGNYSYQRPSRNMKTFQAGYTCDNRDAIVKDNYFVGGNTAEGAAFMRQFAQQTFTGNTIIGSRVLVQNRLAASQNSTWDNNAYYGGENAAGKPFRRNDTTLDFAAWKQATGFDANSTYSPTRPTQAKVFVLPNRYEPGRAHIAIYNWPLQQTVSVDVSGILKPGDRFELRDAQNYYGTPVVSGTYQGGSLQVPMYLTEVAPLVGNVTHFQNTHTAPEFAAFVLLSNQSLWQTSPPQVEAPTISPHGGWVGQGETEVTLSTATPQAQIRYTLDGSLPTETSPLYTGPIRVQSNATLRARTFKQGWLSSPSVVAHFLKYDIETGLQGYWNFEEADGSIVTDRAGAVGNGQMVNQASRQAGAFGTAAYFQGGEDLIRVDSGSHRRQFTVSFWAKADPDADGFPVINGSTRWSTVNYKFEIKAPTNRVSLCSHNGEIVCTDTDEVGDLTQWQHYAGVYDGQQLLLYINGKLAAAKPFTGLAGAGNLLSFGQNFKGALDEVRLYNRALTDQDIAILAGVNTIEGKPFPRS